MFEMNPNKLLTCIGAGRAGHRSTRVACGCYSTRTSQVGGCLFNAQEFEQNRFIAKKAVSVFAFVYMLWQVYMTVSR